jgi:hypothetical protein
MNRIEIILVILSLLISSCRSHHPITAGQADKEKYVKIFKSKVVEEDHKEYIGEIVFTKNENSIDLKYDSASFIINLEDKKYLSLFMSGLIYPQLLGCYNPKGCLIIPEHLDYLNNKGSKRYFRMLIWHENSISPEVILFELTNEFGRKNWNLERFVHNARMTFLYNKGLLQL